MQSVSLSNYNSLTQFLGEIIELGLLKQSYLLSEVTALLQSGAGAKAPFGGFSPVWYHRVTLDKVKEAERLFAL